MIISKLIVFLAVLVLVFSQDPILDVINNPDMLNQVELDKHNRYRLYHGASPLVLSASLIDKAQDYAMALFLANNKLVHSDGAKNGEYGENLYYSEGESSYYYPGDGPSGAWYAEIKDYNFETGEPLTPDALIYHFTAMVWKAVTSVGFGFIRGHQGQKYVMYVVAIYDPTPNTVGSFLENVLPYGTPPPNGWPIPINNNPTGAIEFNRKTTSATNANLASADNTQSNSNPSSNPLSSAFSQRSTASTSSKVTSSNASPARSATPSVGNSAPASKAAVPASKAAVPASKAAVPASKAAAPTTRAAAPASNAASPDSSAASPDSSAASPDSSAASSGVDEAPISRGATVLKPGSFNVTILRQIELARHNEYRFAHGVAGLEIDDTLNRIAQSYANKLLSLHKGIPSSPSAKGKQYG